MEDIKQPSDEVDEFGDDFEYDDEFEAILNAAESQTTVLPARTSRQCEVTDQLETPVEPDLGTEGVDSMDIEDISIPSPLESFRRHGYLSVSDLVGTVWCEVQVSLPQRHTLTISTTSKSKLILADDSRLRTLPYLKPADRPDRIVSTKGKEIVVDKVKTEGRERIVQRGQVCLTFFTA
jgi:exonuclease V